jgi:Tfp pilus assembly protein PilV
MTTSYLIKFKDQAGLGLVEVIAALAITMIVVTALVSMSLFTLRASTQSKLLLESTKQANSTMELVRGYRDQSATWTAFITAIRSCTAFPGAVCTAAISGAAITINGPAAAGTPSANEVKVYFIARNPTNGNAVAVGDQSVRISVEAHWKVGAADKYTHIYTDLTNWQGK